MKKSQKEIKAMFYPEREVEEFAYINNRKRLVQTTTYKAGGYEIKNIKKTIHYKTWKGCLDE